jgi:hypothetical protein
MFGSILILVGIGLFASWWSASALTPRLAASLGAIVGPDADHKEEEPVHH